jgi:hypothetical protein
MTTIIDDDCNIPQKKCETSTMYDKDDIVAIADKCGIDIYKEGGKKLKTRKELCKEIADSQAVIEPVNIPEPQQTTLAPLYTKDIIENTKKPKLLEIAEELGIKKWKGKKLVLS